jgi:hypothetical protein
MTSVRGSVLDYLRRSQSPGLSGSLYFDTSDLGNLLIVVSYQFTPFISFVHLHIIHHNLRTIESSGTRCDDCCSVPRRPLP